MRRTTIATALTLAVVTAILFALLRWPRAGCRGREVRAAQRLFGRVKPANGTLGAMRRFNGKGKSTALKSFVGRRSYDDFLIYLMDLRTHTL